MGADTFLRAEDQSTVLGRDRNRIARRHKCTAGNTPNQIGGRNLTTAHLITKIFHISYSATQIEAQPGNRLKYVNNKAEDDQNQD
jgi:hypothetical protein